MQKDIPTTIFKIVSAFPVGEQAKILDYVERQAATVRGGDDRPIWEIAMEISRSVPLEEWEKLPSDGSINHDHYLYGAPKKY